MNNLNSIVDYLKVFNNINKRPAYKPRTMAQEPRNMYAGGQLVRNTVDGSRPGYDGDSNFNHNPLGKNQFSEIQKTTKEIQEIINSNPDNWTPKDFRGEGKLNNVKKGGVKLLTITDTKKPDIIFKRRGQRDPDAVDKSKQKKNKVRSDKMNLQSNTTILKKMAGKYGLQLSHLSLTELDSLKNLGYLPADINIKGYHSFEKKIVANAKEIYAVQNNKSLALPEKRAEIAKLQKIDRALRKEFPKYASTKARLKVRASNLELSGLKIGEKLPDPTVAISQTEGTLLRDIKVGSQKEKDLLKLSKKSLEAKIKELGGKNNVTKLLANGTANTEQKQVLKEILRMGSGLMRGARQMLNPAEFFKLKNLIGPGAWAAMGAFEAGIIGYDTINRNTPLNEALSDNWVTGWAMPWTKKEAQIKNLEKANISGSPAMQKYMDQVKLMAKYEREYKALDVMKAGITTPMGETKFSKLELQDQEEKLYHLNKEWSDLQATPEGGGELELQNAVSDMEGERKAGYYDPDISEGIPRDLNEFGYRDVGDAPAIAKALFGKYALQGHDPMFETTGIQPIFDLPPSEIAKTTSTKQEDLIRPLKEKYGTSPLKGYHEIKRPLNLKGATTTPLDADTLQTYAENLRNLGYLEPRGELPEWYKDRVQKNEKWRQLFEQSPTGLHGAKFASGGLANLTRTVAPDSEGIMSLKKKW